MAFEKECDYVLEKLKSHIRYHTFSSVYHYLKFEKGIDLSVEELISVVTILKSDNHILVKGKVSVAVHNDTNEKIFEGDLSISGLGIKFFSNTNYQEQKEKNDLMYSITVSNAKIQSSLLHINRWIAVASVAVAVSSLFEIVRNYYNAAFPFLRFLLPILTFFYLGYILYIYLKQKKQ